MKKRNKKQNPEIKTFSHRNVKTITKIQKKCPHCYQVDRTHSASQTCNGINWSFRAKLVTALFSQNWGKEKRFLKKKIANIGAKKAKK